MDNSRWGIAGPSFPRKLYVLYMTELEGAIAQSFWSLEDHEGVPDIRH